MEYIKVMEYKGIALNTFYGYCINISTPIPEDLQQALFNYFEDAFCRFDVYNAIKWHRITVIQEYLDSWSKTRSWIERSRAIELNDALEKLK